MTGLTPGQRPDDPLRVNPAATEPGRPIPTRVLVRSVAQTSVIVVLLMTAYVVVPVDPASTVWVAAVSAAALVAALLIWGFLRQARRIVRSDYPMLAAAETLVILLAAFLLGFAFVYLAVSTSDPDAFSEPLNRTGAFYLAVTVLSTVGFGDITPESDGARWLVTAQMLIDIGLIAGALRLIFGLARAATKRASAQTSVGDKGLYGQHHNHDHSHEGHVQERTRPADGR